MLANPPSSLLDGGSLFLDFDGTLVDLIDRPDGVVADPGLIALLERLNRALGKRLAVVSGRSLFQLDQILGPVAKTFACTGSHGSEHRWHGLEARPYRPASLDIAATRLRPFAEQHPGVIIEEKSFGVALHYRQRPDAEEAALKLAWDVAEEHGFYMQAGKMMVELRVPGGDKGAAVRQLMTRPPMLGTVPVFLGDDRTDEPGFVAAAELGGAGIFVGEPRPTAARYRLDNPAAVREWLASAIG